MLQEKAPAKVNLTLHVLGRRADGYHLLDSIVAFAGVGDHVSLAPGPGLSLTVSGPGAETAGSGDDNLVLKAARALSGCLPGLVLGDFHLTKRLPIAAGIGGGSSDAAAALRLLARQNGLSIDHPAMADAACQVGADVVVCLSSTMKVMRGIGHDVFSVTPPPRLFALLVNPGIPVATPDVFRALGYAVGQADAPPGLPNAIAFADIAAGRNDLEPAALRVAPGIADTLNALRSLAGVRLARMSGSGATCFALFDDCRSCARAARRLHAAHPGWWIKPTVLR